MAALLGLGCSHAPMILNPPEEWANMRKRIYARIPNYQPPASMLQELGDDNGLGHDRQNQQRIANAFAVLRDKLHAWKPDVVIVVGDDQAENFTRDNIPTFCLYTGDQVDAYPFHRPMGKVNLWQAPQDAKYTYRCAGKFGEEMVAHLIRDGFDMASSSELKGWKWGLPHAHINPLLFLDPDMQLTILPLFVNCYGEEAGDGYPPRPTARRCYELGQAIGRFLEKRTERVAVVASSSWSHSFLTHRFHCSAFDDAFDRRNLELLRQGKGSAMAQLTPEEIQQSGDHEFLNWIIPLGMLGERPAQVVDALDEQSQISFKVFAIWDEVEAAGGTS
jgi:aromatic ring-opening dioxygenase catalytic subunit (LigB family)